SYLSLERRHDRSKARGQLRLRVCDRFAYVRLVNSDGLAALKLLLFPENARESWTASAFTVCAVARRTAQRLIQLLTRHRRRRAAGVSAQPVVKLTLLHHDHRSRHAGVIHTAVF